MDAKKLYTVYNATQLSRVFAGSELGFVVVATDEEILTQPCVVAAKKKARADALLEVLHALEQLNEVNAVEAAVAEANDERCEARHLDSERGAITECCRVIQRIQAAS